MNTSTVAALYVETGGVYFGVEGVEPWDEARDARLYNGPHPVIAHPPCKRWGNFWFGSTSPHYTGPRYERPGMDDGCFEAALDAVRTWGGVLEHPSGSRAWRRFGLKTPPRSGGWVSAGDWMDVPGGGWTCSVEQGHYGHPAPKATWLYAYGVKLPSLAWGASDAKGRVELQHSAARLKTPIPFRDLLLKIARTKTVSHMETVMPDTKATHTLDPIPLTAAEQRLIVIFAVILHQGARLVATAKGLKLPQTRALDSIKRFLRTAGLECRREGNAIVAGGVLLRWDSAHLRWACTGKVGRATGTVFGVRLCAEMLAGEVV